ncbi:hypothetical protein ES703_123762 [subsurface metagenome]
MEKDDYTVDRKEEIRKVDRKTGDLLTFYRIWATSKGGTYFHVEVPEDELAKAGDVLAKKAKELDAIR